MAATPTVPHVSVRPETHLAVLSAAEVNDLCAAQNETVYALFRRCALAVLTSGTDSDSARELFAAYRDFDVHFEQVDRGIVLHLQNAPATAFVDGVIVTGVREHLFSVLRDIVFMANDLAASPGVDESTSAGITEIVFRGRRKVSPFAGAVTPSARPNMTTRRRSATSSGCAVSMCVPGAAPGR